jgi:16S rRNA (guanine527-N7)-methyltransferase
MNAKANPTPIFDGAKIEARVAPCLLRPLPPTASDLLARYLQLLSHWNQKMNLTAVRDPEILVRLHFAECLRAAQRIPENVETVLDFGSGAGLPGIPIQLARPGLRVTLAESQKKKAAFLREVVRELDLDRTTVHAGRVEDLPTTAVFDWVTLRAVDKMAGALRVAIPRIRPSQGFHGGGCMILTSQSEVAALIPEPFGGGEGQRIEWALPEAVPGTDQRVIVLGARV